MKYALTFILISVLPLIIACNTQSENSNNQDIIISRDLDQLRERGKLVALTDYNSTSYFIYKGEPMGFQFELLREFADYLQLELVINTENDLNESIDMLKRGDADLLAYNLAVNNERKEKIAFSSPIGQTRQVLVQRRPVNWLAMTRDDLDRIMIRNQIELAGKTVYVQTGSSFVQRLRNLQNEIGDSINIIELPLEVEQLITLVANGEIDYTVADENVALVNNTYYHLLDIETPVSFPQNYAWAVRLTGSDKLLENLNRWIASYWNTRSYALLYAKYFKNSRSKRIVESDYYALSSGKISMWDDYFRSYSDSLGWDWRLLASVAYQESRFEPDATSWAGAYGLMQLMPSTGKRFGINISQSPENNIQAGVRYLEWLEDLFKEKIPSSDERLKFVLASYNVGPGHILDARKLAIKYGSDPNRWDGNVARFILKKSDPEYYHDPVVEHGFCRGEEPFNYVSEILDRYEHYRNIISEK